MTSHQYHDASMSHFMRTLGIENYMSHGDITKILIEVIKCLRTMKETEKEIAILALNTHKIDMDHLYFCIRSQDNYYTDVYTPFTYLKQLEANMNFVHCTKEIDSFASLIQRYL